MPHSTIRLAAALFLVAWSACTVLAEVSYLEVPEEDNLTVIRMTVTPAASPVPVFKHRLVLPALELRTGNAAPFYYRLFLDPDGGLWRVRNETGEEVFDSWYATGIGAVPLEKLPLNKIRDATSGLENQNLVTATSMRNCDWGLDVDSLRGPETISFLLPEFQAIRHLSRFLTLRTRLQLAEKRYGDAIDTMRMTYRLAADTARVPFIVCGLIGIAGAGMANGTMLELIAEPDSPNMYWALAELPNPLIDMREAMRFEMGIGPRIFPFIHHAETTERSPDEWNRLYREAIRELSIIGDMAFGNRDPVGAGVIGTGLALAGYPHAKAQLIEQGFDRERVERMAVGQVIAIYSERAYQRLADEIEKQWYLPHWEGQKLDQEAVQFLKRARALLGNDHREIIPIALPLLPAIDAARNAQVRLQRDVAAMQVIEALRMHAAENDDRLPESLSEITQVPVPLNPATGKDFEYRLEGETGVISLPPSDGIYGFNRRFEITIAQ